MRYRDLFEGDLVRVNFASGKKEPDRNVMFRARGKSTMDRARDLLAALHGGGEEGKYKAALDMQKRGKEIEAQHQSVRDEWKHVSDRDLVNHYKTVARESGDSWHASNAQEHEDVLRDSEREGRAFDRDPTIFAINHAGRIARARSRDE